VSPFEQRLLSRWAVVVLGVVLGWVVLLPGSRAGDDGQPAPAPNAAAKQSLCIPVPNDQVSFVAFLSDGPTLVYHVSFWDRDDAVVLSDPATGKELALRIRSAVAQVRRFSSARVFAIGSKGRWILNAPPAGCGSVRESFGCVHLDHLGSLSGNASANPALKILTCGPFRASASEAVLQRIPSDSFVACGFVCPRPDSFVTPPGRKRMNETAILPDDG
jgi:hypothetical protein